MKGPYLELHELQQLEALLPHAIRDTMQGWKSTRLRGGSASMAFYGNISSSLLKAFDELAAEIKAQPEQEPVLQEIEQYRMQMAGISTAASGYWKEGDDIHPDYDTIALRDVAKLYAKYDALYKEQPEQEPVAWMRQDGQRVTTASDRHNYPDYEIRYSIPLYTAPPQREWQRLTDKEREEATGWSVEHIEAKLKEKNNV